MPVLVNEVRVDAPREAVWSVLASLDLLERYDPGISSSRVVGERPAGLDSSRKCELAPGGWFVERVVTFEPPGALAFELVECSLPVRRLRHDYTLTERGGTTVVRQRMDYRLKYGFGGAVLDAVVVRRKWDAGIKAFLHGLKEYAEAGQRAAAER